jgi:HSP20 family protein
MAEEQPQGLRPFLEVHQEVRRLFQELVYRPWGSQGLASPQSWQPRCDMVETDEAIIVEVELPGVTCEEVRLEVEGDVLRMTGERRAATQRQGRNYHYLEQHYGQFERQLRLPRSVDRDAMHAECVNGILRITLPKTREQPTSSAQTRKDAP